MNEAEKKLRETLSGQDIAEIAIEAWREAYENGFDRTLNPFERGTYEHTEYVYACYKENGTQNQRAENVA